MDRIGGPRITTISSSKLVLNKLLYPRLSYYMYSLRGTRADDRDYLMAKLFTKFASTSSNLNIPNCYTWSINEKVIAKFDHNQ